jgi:hypothetical protein
MAGAAGFEPAHAGTKNRCLTAWRRPKKQNYINHISFPDARLRFWFSLKRIFFHIRLHDTLLHERQALKLTI